MSFCLRLLFCLLQFTPTLSYPNFFPHYFTRWPCSYSLLLSHSPSSSSQINISMSLLSLSSPDESSLHYEIEFIIKQKWIDPRLVHDDGNRWKKEDKKFISWISSQVPNPERSPPSRRHLEARHLLHQARYFQGKSVESPIKDGFHANSFVNIGINTIL